MKRVSLFTNLRLRDSRHRSKVDRRSTNDVNGDQLLRFFNLPPSATALDASAGIVVGRMAWPIMSRLTGTARRKARQGVADAREWVDGAMAHFEVSLLAAQ